VPQAIMDNLPQILKAYNIVFKINSMQTDNCRLLHNKISQ